MDTQKQRKVPRKKKEKSSFRERVLHTVKNIQRGSTLTYGEVARRAGNAHAARAVGAILHTNYDPDIPCHRVVASGGLGGYNRGVRTKRKKLNEEGVTAMR